VSSGQIFLYLARADEGVDGDESDDDGDGGDRNVTREVTLAVGGDFGFESWRDATIITCM
jgi:hypothetical protein